jgi:hypothetical protein
MKGTLLSDSSYHFLTFHKSGTEWGCGISLKLHISEHTKTRIRANTAITCKTKLIPVYSEQVSLTNSRQLQTKILSY